MNILLVALQLVSSHHTSSFVFFFPMNSFLYLKLLLTIGYPRLNFTFNLQYTSLIIVFFLTAYFLSFSTSVTQTYLFYFVDADKISTIIKIYNINWDG